MPDKVKAIPDGFHTLTPHITLRDDEETRRLQFFSGRMQEIENNLPIEPQYRNPKLGAMAAEPRRPSSMN